jgi:hypothetical protein
LSQFHGCWPVNGSRSLGSIDKTFWYFLFLVEGNPPIFAAAEEGGGTTEQRVSFLGGFSPQPSFICNPSLTCVCVWVRKTQQKKKTAVTGPVLSVRKIIGNRCLNF